MSQPWSPGLDADHVIAFDGLVSPVEYVESGLGAGVSADVSVSSSSWLMPSLVPIPVVLGHPATIEIRRVRRAERWGRRKRGAGATAALGAGLDLFPLADPSD